MSLHNNGYGPVGRLVKPPVDLLICFAVKEEMKFFRNESWKSGSIQVWVTGIGRKNAAENIREAIARVQPERVISAGFAGGLNPALKLGTVIYEQDFDAGFLRGSWRNWERCRQSFIATRRVAITTARKNGRFGRKHPPTPWRWNRPSSAPFATSSKFRARLCESFPMMPEQDLPLDFNALMTSEDRIRIISN